MVTVELDWIQRLKLENVLTDRLRDMARHRVEIERSLAWAKYRKDKPQAKSLKKALIFHDERVRSVTELLSLVGAANMARVRMERAARSLRPTGER